MLNMRVQGKRRRGRPKKRWLGNIRDDMKDYKMTENMAQNRSVFHMKTKAGTLLHGGGLEEGAKKVRKNQHRHFHSPSIARQRFVDLLQILPRHLAVAVAILGEQLHLLELEFDEVLSRAVSQLPLVLVEDGVLVDVGQRAEALATQEVHDHLVEGLAGTHAVRGRLVHE